MKVVYTWESEDIIPLSRMRITDETSEFGVHLDEVFIVRGPQDKEVFALVDFRGRICTGWRDREMLAELLTVMNYKPV